MLWMVRPGRGTNTYDQAVTVKRSPSVSAESSGVPDEGGKGSSCTRPGPTADRPDATRRIPTVRRSLLGEGSVKMQRIVTLVTSAKRATPVRIAPLTVPAWPSRIWPVAIRRGRWWSRARGRARRGRASTGRASRGRRRRGRASPGCRRPADRAREVFGLDGKVGQLTEKSISGSAKSKPRRARAQSIGP